MGMFIAFLMGAPWLTAAPAEGVLRYNRDVRPILTRVCFECHGPDEAARAADLRLDVRESAVDYGAIVPGDPESSALVERIRAEDADLRMPPPASHKELTEQEKEILVAWIRQGAEYQPHWAFAPLVRPDLPAVSNKSWVRNPIDQFILARLESDGLTPAPEADRRTIARRAALDLIGLPPLPDLRGPIRGGSFGRRV